ncbi:MAG: hypothetical protein Q4G52_11295, partial [Clostridia bacterium]|nr:hypothetical protein [Clostridia bacterium]
LSHFHLRHFCVFCTRPARPPDAPARILSIYIDVQSPRFFTHPIQYSKIFLRLPSSLRPYGAA